MPYFEILAIQASSLIHAFLSDLSTLCANRLVKITMLTFTYGAGFAASNTVDGL